MQQYGWDMSGNHNMGSWAIKHQHGGGGRGAGVARPFFVRRRPNTLDHNLIWDDRNDELLAEVQGDHALRSESRDLRSAASVTSRELLHSHIRRRLASMQPVKDLHREGVCRPHRGERPEPPSDVAVEKFVTRTDDKGRVWGKDQAVDRQTAFGC